MDNRLRYLVSFEADQRSVDQVERAAHSIESSTQDLSQRDASRLTDSLAQARQQAAGLVKEVDKAIANSGKAGHKKLSAGAQQELARVRDLHREIEAVHAAIEKTPELGIGLDTGAILRDFQALEQRLLGQADALGKRLSSKLGGMLGEAVRVQVQLDTAGIQQQVRTAVRQAEQQRATITVGADTAEARQGIREVAREAERSEEAQRRSARRTAAERRALNRAQEAQAARLEREGEARERRRLAAPARRSAAPPAPYRPQAPVPVLAQSSRINAARREAQTEQAALAESRRLEASQQRWEAQQRRWEEDRAKREAQQAQSRFTTAAQRQRVLDLRRQDALRDEARRDNRRARVQALSTGQLENRIERQADGRVRRTEWTNRRWGPTQDLEPTFGARTGARRPRTVRRQRTLVEEPRHLPSPDLAQANLRRTLRDERGYTSAGARRRVRPPSTEERRISALAYYQTVSDGGMSKRGELDVASYRANKRYIQKRLSEGLPMAEDPREIREAIRVAGELEGLRRELLARRERLQKLQTEERLFHALPAAKQRVRAAELTGYADADAQEVREHFEALRGDARASYEEARQELAYLARKESADYRRNVKQAPMPAAGTDPWGEFGESRAERNTRANVTAERMDRVQRDRIKARRSRGLQPGFTRKSPVGSVASQRAYSDDELRAQSEQIVRRMAQAGATEQQIADALSKGQHGAAFQHNNKISTLTYHNPARLRRHGEFFLNPERLIGQGKPSAKKLMQELGMEFTFGADRVREYDVPMGSSLGRLVSEADLSENRKRHINAPFDPAAGSYRVKAEDIARVLDQSGRSPADAFRMLNESLDAWDLMPTVSRDAANTLRNEATLRNLPGLRRALDRRDDARPFDFSEELRDEDDKAQRGLNVKDFQRQDYTYQRMAALQAGQPLERYVQQFADTRDLSLEPGQREMLQELREAADKRPESHRSDDEKALLRWNKDGAITPEVRKVLERTLAEEYRSAQRPATLADLGRMTHLGPGQHRELVGRPMASLMALPEAPVMKTTAKVSQMHAAMTGAMQDMLDRVFAPGADEQQVSRALREYRQRLNTDLVLERDGNVASSDDLRAQGWEPSDTGMDGRVDSGRISAMNTIERRMSPAEFLGINVETATEAQRLGASLGFGGGEAGRLASLNAKAGDTKLDPVVQYQQDMNRALAELAQNRFRIAQLIQEANAEVARGMRLTHSPLADAASRDSQADQGELTAEEFVRGELAGVQEQHNDGDIRNISRAHLPDYLERMDLPQPKGERLTPEQEQELASRRLTRIQQMMLADQRREWDAQFRRSVNANYDTSKTPQWNEFKDVVAERERAGTKVRETGSGLHYVREVNPRTGIRRAGLRRGTPSGWGVRVPREARSYGFHTPPQAAPSHYTENWRTNLSRAPEVLAARLGPQYVNTSTLRPVNTDKVFTDAEATRITRDKHRAEIKAKREHQARLIAQALRLKAMREARKVQVTQEPKAGPAVTSFRGEHGFLSNFHPAPVEFEGRTYPTVENAFQAAKTADAEARRKFEAMSPAQAKQAGGRRGGLVLRPDWEQVKDGIMRGLLEQKFGSGELRDQLAATAGRDLREGNTWGDRYWGVDARTGQGENRLGRMLMEIRETQRPRVTQEPKPTREPLALTEVAESTRPAPLALPERAGGHELHDEAMRAKAERAEETQARTERSAEETKRRNKNLRARARRKAQGTALKPGKTPLVGDYTPPVPRPLAELRTLPYEDLTKQEDEILGAFRQTRRVREQRLREARQRLADEQAALAAEQAARDARAAEQRALIAERRPAREARAAALRRGREIAAGLGDLEARAGALGTGEGLGAAQTLRVKALEDALSRDLAPAPKESLVLDSMGSMRGVADAAGTVAELPREPLTAPRSAQELLNPSRKLTSFAEVMDSGLKIQYDVTANQSELRQLGQQVGELAGAARAAAATAPVLDAVADKQAQAVQDAVTSLVSLPEETYAREDLVRRMAQNAANERLVMTKTGGRMTPTTGRARWPMQTAEGREAAAEARARAAVQKQVQAHLDATRTEAPEAPQGPQGRQRWPMQATYVEREQAKRAAAVAAAGRNVVLGDLQQSVSALSGWKTVAALVPQATAQLTAQVQGFLTALGQNLAGLNGGRAYAAPGLAGQPTPAAPPAAPTPPAAPAAPAAPTPPQGNGGNGNGGNGNGGSGNGYGANNGAAPLGQGRLYLPDQERESLSPADLIQKGTWGQMMAAYGTSVLPDMNAADNLIEQYVGRELADPLNELGHRMRDGGERVSDTLKQFVFDTTDMGKNSSKAYRENVAIGQAKDEMEGLERIAGVLNKPVQLLNSSDQGEGLMGAMNDITGRGARYLSRQSDEFIRVLGRYAEELVRTPQDGTRIMEQARAELAGLRARQSARVTDFEGAAQDEELGDKLSSGRLRSSRERGRASAGREADDKFQMERTLERRMLLGQGELTARTPDQQSLLGMLKEASGLSTERLSRFSGDALREMVSVAQDVRAGTASIQDLALAVQKIASQDAAQTSGNLKASAEKRVFDREVEEMITSEPYFLKRAQELQQQVNAGTITQAERLNTLRSEGAEGLNNRNQARGAVMAGVTNMAAFVAGSAIESGFSAATEQYVQYRRAEQILKRAQESQGIQGGGATRNTPFGEVGLSAGGKTGPALGLVNRLTSDFGATSDQVAELYVQLNDGGTKSYAETRQAMERLAASAKRTGATIDEITTAMDGLNAAGVEDPTSFINKYAGLKDMDLAQLGATAEGMSKSQYFQLSSSEDREQLIASGTQQDFAGFSDDLYVASQQAAVLKETLDQTQMPEPKTGFLQQVEKFAGLGATTARFREVLAHIVELLTPLAGMLLVVVNAVMEVFDSFMDIISVVPAFKSLVGVVASMALAYYAVGKAALWMNGVAGATMAQAIAAQWTKAMAAMMAANASLRTSLAATWVTIKGLSAASLWSAIVAGFGRAAAAAKVFTASMGWIGLAIAGITALAGGIAYLAEQQKAAAQKEKEDAERASTFEGLRGAMNSGALGGVKIGDPGRVNPGSAEAAAVARFSMGDNEAQLKAMGLTVDELTENLADFATKGDAGMQRFAQSVRETAAQIQGFRNIVDATLDDVKNYADQTAEAARAEDGQNIFRRYLGWRDGDRKFSVDYETIGVKAAREKLDSQLDAYLQEAQAKADKQFQSGQIGDRQSWTRDTLQELDPQTWLKYQEQSRAYAEQEYSLEAKRLQVRQQFADSQARLLDDSLQEARAQDAAAAAKQRGLELLLYQMRAEEQTLGIVHDTSEIEMQINDLLVQREQHEKRIQQLRLDQIVALQTQKDLIDAMNNTGIDPLTGLPQGANGAGLLSGDTTVQDLTTQSTGIRDFANAVIKAAQDENVPAADRRRLQGASVRFQAAMPQILELEKVYQTFKRRLEAIQDDETLSDTQKKKKIETLVAETRPVFDGAVKAVESRLKAPLKSLVDELGGLLPAGGLNLMEALGNPSVSQPFGPADGRNGYTDHQATDLKLPVGTRVAAPDAGRLKITDNDPTGAYDGRSAAFYAKNGQYALGLTSTLVRADGSQVTLAHGSREATRKAIEAEFGPGAYERALNGNLDVRAGQAIYAVGMTGNTRGPHLEISETDPKTGKFVDPQRKGGVLDPGRQGVPLALTGGGPMINFDNAFNRLVNPITQRAAVAATQEALDDLPSDNLSPDPTLAARAQQYAETAYDQELQVLRATRDEAIRLAKRNFERKQTAINLKLSTEQNAGKRNDLRRELASAVTARDRAINAANRTFQQNADKALPGGVIKGIEKATQPANGEMTVEIISKRIQLLTAQIKRARTVKDKDGKTLKQRDISAYEALEEQLQGWRQERTRMMEDRGETYEDAQLWLKKKWRAVTGQAVGEENEVRSWAERMAKEQLSPAQRKALGLGADGKPIPGSQLDRMIRITDGQNNSKAAAGILQNRFELDQLQNADTPENVDYEGYAEEAKRELAARGREFDTKYAKDYKAGAERDYARAQFLEPWLRLANTMQDALENSRKRGEYLDQYQRELDNMYRQATGQAVKLENAARTYAQKVRDDQNLSAAEKRRLGVDEQGNVIRGTDLDRIIQITDQQNRSRASADALRGRYDLDQLGKTERPWEMDYAAYEAQVQGKIAEIGAEFDRTAQERYKTDDERQQARANLLAPWLQLADTLRGARESEAGRVQDVSRLKQSFGNLWRQATGQAPQLESATQSLIDQAKRTKMKPEDRRALGLDDKGNVIKGSRLDTMTQVLNARQASQSGAEAWAQRREMERLQNADTPWKIDYEGNLKRAQNELARQRQVFDRKYGTLPNMTDEERAQLRLQHEAPWLQSVQDAQNERDRYRDNVEALGDNMRALSASLGTGAPEGQFERQGRDAMRSAEDLKGKGSAEYKQAQELFEDGKKRDAADLAFQDAGRKTALLGINRAGQAFRQSEKDLAAYEKSLRAIGVTGANLDRIMDPLRQNVLAQGKAFQDSARQAKLAWEETARVIRQLSDELALSSFLGDDRLGAQQARAARERAELATAQAEVSPIRLAQERESFMGENATLMYAQFKDQLKAADPKVFARLSALVNQEGGPTIEDEEDILKTIYDTVVLPNKLAANGKQQDLIRKRTTAEIGGELRGAADMYGAGLVDRYVGLDPAQSIEDLIGRDITSITESLDAWAPRDKTGIANAAETEQGARKTLSTLIGLRESGVLGQMRDTRLEMDANTRRLQDITGNSPEELAERKRLQDANAALALRMRGYVGALQQLFPPSLVAQIEEGAISSQNAAVQAIGELYNIPIEQARAVADRAQAREAQGYQQAQAQGVTAGQVRDYFGTRRSALQTGAQGVLTQAVGGYEEELRRLQGGTLDLDAAKVSTNSKVQAAYTRLQRAKELTPESSDLAIIQGLPEQLTGVFFGFMDALASLNFDETQQAIDAALGQLDRQTRLRDARSERTPQQQLDDALALGDFAGAGAAAGQINFDLAQRILIRDKEKNKRDQARPLAELADVIRANENDSNFTDLITAYEEARKAQRQQVRERALALMLDEQDEQVERTARRARPVMSERAGREFDVRLAQKRVEAYTTAMTDPAFAGLETVLDERARQASRDLREAVDAMQNAWKDSLRELTKTVSDTLKGAFTSVFVAGLDEMFRIKSDEEREAERVQRDGASDLGTIEAQIEQLNRGIADAEARLRDPSLTAEERSTWQGVLQDRIRERDSLVNEGIGLRHDLAYQAEEAERMRSERYTAIWRDAVASMKTAFVETAFGEAWETSVGKLLEQATSDLLGIEEPEIRLNASEFQASVNAFSESAGLAVTQAHEAANTFRDAVGQFKTAVASMGQQGGGVVVTGSIGLGDAAPQPGDPGFIGPVMPTQPTQPSQPSQTPSLAQPLSIQGAPQAPAPAQTPTPKAPGVGRQLGAAAVGMAGQAVKVPSTGVPLADYGVGIAKTAVIGGLTAVAGGTGTFGAGALAALGGPAAPALIALGAAVMVAQNAMNYMQDIKRWKDQHQYSNNFEKTYAWGNQKGRYLEMEGLGSRKWDSLQVTVQEPLSSPGAQREIGRQVDQQSSLRRVNLGVSG